LGDGCIHGLHGLEPRETSARFTAQGSSCSDDELHSVTVYYCNRNSTTFSTARGVFPMGAHDSPATCARIVKLAAGDLDLPLQPASALRGARITHALLCA